MEKNTNPEWRSVIGSLSAQGFTHLTAVLSEEECAEIAANYRNNNLFRSTINMQRYRFGQGEYKYFSYPLPATIQSLREKWYSALVPLANEWMGQLGSDTRYPETLERFLALCHSKNQMRPTPLVLQYTEGGYNTLHQDMYGEIFFPFQVVFMLTQPAVDYQGGELVFVEQIPRAQSRAQVLRPALGDAVIFTTNFRPVKGARGYYRSKMKHGVSTVSKGLRYSMGLIFHDAA